MATFGKYESIPGLIATSTLAAAQYKVVQLSSTAGQVKLATSGTSKIVGVVQNDPAAGEAADVAFLGVVKGAAETSVSVGDYLTASSTGRLKSTTTTGHVTLGIALEASDTAGDIIRFVAVPGVYAPAA